MSETKSAISEWRARCRSGRSNMPCGTIGLPSKCNPAPGHYMGGFENVRTLLPPSFTERRRAASFTIAAHIRRGDLWDYVKANTGKGYQRFVANMAYIALLKQTLTDIRKSGFDDEIEIRIVTEGADARGVPDVVPGMRTPATAFTSHISGVKATVVKGTSLDAFHAMCKADLLIAGTSGFSQLAAFLCPRVFVLAIPFWNSYACASNVHMLQRTANGSFPVRKGAPPMKITSNLTNPCTLQVNQMRQIYCT